MRLLLVEDDPRLMEALERELEREGHRVHVARTGDDALARTAAEDYDAVVLDARIGSGDAYAVCSELRRRDDWLPVLMLGDGNLGERLRGYEAGADDWLGAPVDFSELRARLRALLRRGRQPQPTVLEISGVRLDLVSHAVHRAGEEISLSPREFAVLEYLMRRAGRPVSRKALLEDVWGGERVVPNTVDVYVGYVRKKLESAGGGRVIRTVRGVGWVFEDR